MAEGQELGCQELLPRQPFASAKLLSLSQSGEHGTNPSPAATAHPQGFLAGKCESAP